MAGPVELSAPDQRRLVAALARHVERASGAAARLIETHISYVIVAGDTAWKLKKALTLPFVDYGTLARRRACCEEELRLNRRLAPALYRDVVTIGGSVTHPVFDAVVPLDYAVRMRAFDAGALLAERLAAGDLPPERIDALAAVVADFHARIPRATPEQRYGLPARVLADALENFDEVAPLAAASHREALARLRRWTQQAFDACAGAIDARRRSGFVREAHGDMHIGNVALVDGQVTVFDGIEFDAHLRWIDTMSEAAFVAMDLASRGRDDYGWRFLNGYLDATGDFGGLDVLRFHLVYRAMVRAKVRYLRAAQAAGDGGGAAARAEAGRYVDLADRLAHARQPAVVIAHGVAGSGKSTLCAALAERLPGVRVRSDRERRRLHGDGAMRYDAATTAQVYARLRACAAHAAGAGYAALVDATFLARAQRAALRALAAERRAPFAILALDAPEALLHARVARRAAAGADASEATPAVLAAQLAQREPLGDDERADAVAVDATAPDVDDVLARLRAHLAAA